jgi:hypothetical protein
LPGCCSPDPVMVFLPSAQQMHPRLGVGPTPLLPHPLFPQIPPSLIPVSVNEGENLLQMLVVSSVDLLAQLLPCERCLGFAGCGVAEMHQRSDDASEALPTACRRSCQCGNGLLFLHREIGWLLDEAPTQRPERCGHGHQWHMVVSVPLALGIVMTQKSLDPFRAFRTSQVQQGAAATIGSRTPLVSDIPGLTECHLAY